MSRPDRECSVRGATALGTCTRCDRPICARHRIVSEAGLQDLKSTGVLCPACDDLRIAERDAPGALGWIYPSPTELTFLAMIGAPIRRLLGRN